MQDGIELADARSSAWQTYRLGWPVFLRLPVATVVRFGLFALLPAVIVRMFAKTAHLTNTVLVAGAVLVVLLAVYDIICLRAMRLYTDQDGVWLQAGVMPWNRGITGVKWRDVSEATCNVGFFSWITKSYTVRVGHRFTNGAELVVPGVKRGDQATGHINDVLTNPGAFLPVR